MQGREKGEKKYGREQIKSTERRDNTRDQTQQRMFVEVALFRKEFEFLRFQQLSRCIFVLLRLVGILLSVCAARFL